MGKNSLTKSTTKKKAAAKKSEEKKKKKTARKTAAPKASAAKKKASSTAKKAAAKQSITAKKTVTAKGGGAKKKPAAKKKTAPAAKSTPKKAAPKKKPSRKELLRKQFPWPAPAISPPPKKAVDKERSYSSPPYIAATDANEVQRIRSVLSRQFSMKEIRFAAEKAAVEKVEAEKKAAAEKAAAEKAEAEKKEAAEKAAAEKAEAEKKEAAEKAAAEKAEAEKKAAAEKAAAEKAEEEKVTVSYPHAAAASSGQEDEDRTLTYAMIGMGAFVALLFLILVAASTSNTGKFYLQKTDQGLEIQRGRFAPMGTKAFMTLPAQAAPARLKDVYTKNEVYPLIFDHFIDEADRLLNQSEIPDFDRIRGILNRALEFAVTDDMRDRVFTRINGIDLMLLLYKADVAASRGSLDDLHAALDHLEEAALFDVDDSQARVIEEKTRAIENRIAELEAAASTEAETGSPPAE